MWIFAINLPLIIGNKIPEDDTKECFLLLLDIVQFCTAKVSSSAHAGILEALIHDHHELFNPNASVTPVLRCATWCTSLTQ